MVGYAVKTPSKTLWENKEKMTQHIIGIVSLLTQYEKNLVKREKPIEFREQYMSYILS
jgi:hypothetical protein